MKSLAEFIREKREHVGLTISTITKKCNVKEEIIEGIESSQELFLPVTIRQNLAKGLKISPKEIKMHEKIFEPDKITYEAELNIRELILQGETEIACPKCGSPLVVKIEEMYDMYDKLCKEPKAHCSKCTYQLK